MEIFIKIILVIFLFVVIPFFHFHNGYEKALESDKCHEVKYDTVYVVRPDTVIKHDTLYILKLENTDK
jgi:hypothetical protein